MRMIELVLSFQIYLKDSKGKHIIIHSKNVTYFERLKTLDISFTKKNALNNHKKICKNTKQNNPFSLNILLNT